jgi:hypothetical protein
MPKRWKQRIEKYVEKIKRNNRIDRKDRKICRKDGKRIEKNM